MARFTRNKKFWFAAVIVLAAAVIVVLEATNTTHFFHKSAKVSAPGKPITQLPAKTAPAKNPSTSNTNTDEGSLVDKNGQTPSGISNDPSQWATSVSGDVTLKTPVKNGTLKSGGTIAGSASAESVQYRLIDNQAGVISQGTISVVKGNFTAAVTFTSYAGSGRLDVFNVDPNGKEINEVQVPVNF